MARKPNLLPCPFCGQDMNAKFAAVKGRDTEGDWSVLCTKCGANGPVGQKRGIYTRWNKRDKGASDED